MDIDSLLFTLFALVITYLAYIKIRDYFSPLKNIPGPAGYGPLKQLPYIFNHRDFLGVLHRWGKEFHENGMFKMDLLQNPDGCSVILLKSEYFKEVLKKTTVFESNRYAKDFIPLLGNGMITSKGEDHRYQKKKLAKAFSSFETKKYVPFFNRHAIVLTEIFQNLAKDEKNGKNIDIKRYCMRMSFDVVGEISFGYSFDSQKKELNPFIKAMVDLSEGVLALKARSILRLFPFMWYMPFGPAKTLRTTCEMATKVLDEVISTRSKLMENDMLTDTQQNDLLAALMNEKDPYFTDELIKASVFTFLLAGYLTTSTGLQGILLHLAKHPEMQEKVREEINDNIDDFQNFITDNLDKLKYTDAFIKESLRLFSPSTMIRRDVTADYELGGQVIPKGTSLLLLTSYVNRVEYINGEDFLPERWLDANLQQEMHFSFGYGPRACIGKHFALLEIKVTIVQLLRRFRFTIDPEHEKYEFGIGFGLKVYPDILIRTHTL